MSYQSPLRQINGCLSMVLWSTLLIPIAVLGVFFAYSRLTWYDRVSDMAPDALEPSYFFSGNNGHFSGLVQFSISPEAAASIRRGGSAFLTEATGSDWFPTPLPRSLPVDSDCGNLWCTSGQVADEAARLAEKPNGFYSRNLTEDRDIMLVNIDERTLIVSYSIR